MPDLDETQASPPATINELFLSQPVRITELFWDGTPHVVLMMGTPRFGVLAWLLERNAAKLLGQHLITISSPAENPQ